MIIAGIVIVVFLVLCFFYCLKKNYFDVVCWLVNFVLFGLAGVLVGTVISFMLGNFVVPSESILVETRALEPVIAEGKEVFAIKNKQSYFYFTKSKLSDCALVIGSVLLEERGIRFDGDIRTVNKYRIIPKGNLKWFFFSSKSKNELVLLSKEDIL